jgi:hypothetical protein
MYCISVISINVAFGLQKQIHTCHARLSASQRVTLRPYGRFPNNFILGLSIFSFSKMKVHCQRHSSEQTRTAIHRNCFKIHQTADVTHHTFQPTRISHAKNHLFQFLVLYHVLSGGACLNKYAAMQTLSNESKVKIMYHIHKLRTL